MGGVFLKQFMLLMRLQPTEDCMAWHGFYGMGWVVGRYHYPLLGMRVYMALLRDVMRGRRWGWERV